jgi:hypothetical protein
MEIVGGLLVAEQVVSTTVEAGALGAYSIRKPTLPLSATLKQIATSPSPSEVSTDSLARFAHTIASIDDDVFIFGGQVSQTELAGNEMHMLKLGNVQGLGSDYRCVPSLPAREGDDVPRARAGHTLVPIEGKLVLFGGYEDLKTKTPIDENGRIWVFDPASLSWAHIEPLNEKVPARHSHGAVVWGKSMIIHGGWTGDATPASDTWQFSMGSHVWGELPSISSHAASAPITAQAPPNFAIASSTLYLISHSSTLNSQINMLDLVAEGGAKEWSTIAYPTNPLTSGPRSRRAASLVPINTGLGRQYLIFILGAKTEESEHSAYTTAAPRPDSVTESTSTSLEAAPESWSDIWALQLPSPANTPAYAKDVARQKLGLNSHEAEWAEVEIVTPDKDVDLKTLEGKQHPGPRAYTAATVLAKNRILIWGGENPRGEAEGDGWFLDMRAADDHQDEEGFVTKNWNKMKAMVSSE